jgi:hypothetical protein
MHNSSKSIKSTSIREIGIGNSIHIQSRTKAKKQHKVQKILELKWSLSKNCDNQIGNAKTLFP